jgi:hypothetical protein
VDNADLEGMLSKRNRVMERDIVDRKAADREAADNAVADNAVADKTVADKQEVQIDKRNSQDRT